MRLLRSEFACFIPFPILGDQVPLQQALHVQEYRLQPESKHFFPHLIELLDLHLQQKTPAHRLAVVQNSPLVLLGEEQFFPERLSHLAHFLEYWIVALGTVQLDFSHQDDVEAVVGLFASVNDLTFVNHHQFVQFQEAVSEQVVDLHEKHVVRLQILGQRQSIRIVAFAAIFGYLQKDVQKLFFFADLQTRQIFKRSSRLLAILVPSNQWLRLCHLYISRLTVSFYLLGTVSGQLCLGAKRFYSSPAKKVLVQRSLNELLPVKLLRFMLIFSYFAARLQVMFLLNFVLQITLFLPDCEQYLSDPVWIFSAVVAQGGDSD